MPDLFLRMNAFIPAPHKGRPLMERAAAHAKYDNNTARLGGRGRRLRAGSRRCAR